MPFVAGQRGLASDMLVEHNADGTHNMSAGSLPEHGAAQHSDTVRVEWFKPNVGPASTRSQHGKYPSVLLDLATETALFAVRVPDNFVSLGTVRVVVIPTTTGTFDWTCNTAAGAAGEDESLATDTATADGKAATDDQLTAVAVTGAFDGLSLAAGDFIGVELILDVLTTTTEVHVIGLEFGYTANQ